MTYLSESASGNGQKTSRKASIFGALGEAARKVVDSQRSMRAEKQEGLAAQKAEVGAMVTSGKFGMHCVEIYENGYVRVYAWQGPLARGRAKYERLLNIEFQDGSPMRVEAPLVDSQSVRAITGLLKTGFKASVPGLALAGVEKVMKMRAGKSTLTITTNKNVHLLSNASSEFGIVRHDEVAVGRSLEAAGRAVINLDGMAARSIAWIDEESPESVTPNEDAAALSHGAGAAESRVSERSLGDRLRELAALHQEGVLDDVEFAAAKAKLLEGL